MHWRYEWVDALPRDVYDILVRMLNDDAARPDDQDVDDDQDIADAIGRDI